MAERAASAGRGVGASIGGLVVDGLDDGGLLRAGARGSLFLGGGVVLMGESASVHFVLVWFLAGTLA